LFIWLRERGGRNGLGHVRGGAYEEGGGEMGGRGGLNVRNENFGRCLGVSNISQIGNEKRKRIGRKQQQAKRRVISRRKRGTEGPPKIKERRATKGHAPSYLPKSQH